ncbi:MAG: twitching motility protein PilT [Solirubrobacteraceae bacterium]|nr:twitching motility protein PilT [Solirubrobacteraceae bacterium]
MSPLKQTCFSAVPVRPMTFGMFDIDDALRYLIVNEGSDLHLKVPSQPIVRIHGNMLPIEGSEPLKAEDTERVVREILHDPNKLSEFENENEVDFSYQIEGLARFRVNAFRQRGYCSLVMRAIPVNIKTPEELLLPPAITRLAEEERGIILLTGTTGSGKSTTLAAMIDHINRTMKKHIVTIEDPIEFLHPDRQSIVNQREVGQDTASFKRALRRVLRQDPDVILVGEMRDEETVQTALSAAETGHLVLSTLHTVDAVEAINRIIDFFPPHQEGQARAMIAGTLKGIISQRLVRTVDGGGRVATCEILTMTGRVHDMILDPEMTGNLHEVLKEGEYYGMQTFDQHLLKHLQAGRVSYKEALHVASSPHDFKLMVQADRSLQHLASANAEEEETPDAVVASISMSAPPAVVADIAPAPPVVVPEPAPVPVLELSSAPAPGYTPSVPVLDLEPPTSESVAFTSPPPSGDALDLGPPPPSGAPLDMAPPAPSGYALDIAPPPPSGAPLDLAPPPPPSGDAVDLDPPPSGPPPGF